MTAGYHTLTFVGLDSAGGDNTAFIDGVTLAVAPTTPTLGDSSFEAPALGTGGYQYAPAGTPWTFTGNAGITANRSAFTGGNPDAPDGAQVGFLQTTGTITQTVTFATAGSFVVSFLAAQRGNNGGSTQDFQVLIDGQAVGTFQPTGTAYKAYATGSFTVAANSQHTITFVGLNSAGGDNTAFIDQVQFVAASSTLPIMQS